jgi:rare lipoprotein A
VRFLTLALLFFCFACTARGQGPRGRPTAKSDFFQKHPELRGFTQVGFATYYHDKFQGRKTASGEPYNKKKLTCAHRTLPFGTVVRVENLQNGKVVEVRVTDRGPYGGGGRIIDLSRAAAEEIDMIRAGKVRVRVTVLDDQ